MAGVPRDQVTSVRVTTELLAVLGEEWSDPLQIAFTQLGGVWTMIFRKHACQPADNGQMIRVQADRDSSVELDCLEAGCVWSWSQWSADGRTLGKDLTLADLLRIAVSHRCGHRGPCDDGRCPDLRAHAEGAHDL